MDVFYGGQDVGGSSGWYLRTQNKDTRWGDQGDGTFVNPILNADYSDPDVIRVGEKYYMICSDFHFIGIPVLESDDMVNWKIIGQVYDKFDFPEYDKNERYGGGSWAPVIRYHDGKFWVFFCSPHEGLFMSNATNPEGPWSPLLNVKNIYGWEDPCPFWDDNGDAYLGRSQLGGGPIIVHKMKPDGTALLDEGVTVYEGPVAEGTKMFKKDGYYYMSIPEGGVATGWQTVLRSENIYGPYEQKIVLEQGATNVNGPHQGAFVDTPEGEWWFYHFQSKEPLGRIVHLQPTRWEDGWPVVGVDKDMNGIGEPVKEWAKPNINKTVAITAPQTSDDFSSSQLAVQWQFNHNPVNTHWSLTERPGHLTIKALKASKLKDARNMFTQKMMGFFGEASTEINCSRMTEGQRAGLACIGNKYNAIGVERRSSGNFIYIELDGSSQLIVKVTEETVYFKALLNSNSNEFQLYYSLDNVTYTPCKDKFSLGSADWKGSRVGLFSYNTKNETGEADFNWFDYKCDGPGGFTYEEDDSPKYADWHVWNEMATLVKNNGDGTFSLVQEYDANMQVTIWTNSVFFDYDNDGNLDLLVVGKGGDWRFPMSSKYAKLYRNLGEEGNYLFEEVYNTGFRQECDEMYFNTISVGDYDNDGYNDVLIMSYDTDRSVDLYKNMGGTGKFEIQECALPKDGSGTPGKFRSASNGSVMFGDINNDGWLDIFFTGYSNVADGIRIYMNMKNGTFKDITPDNIKGSFQSQSVLADVNGDGTLDVIVTGHGDGWARYSRIYYNTVNPTTQMPEFTLKESDQTGIVPINKANLLFADFNNDGRMDLVVTGYDGENDLTRVYYQNENQKFISDTGHSIISTKEGGINMGDINGDNNMDIIIAGEKGSNAGDAYGSPVRIYENKPTEAGRINNEPPTAPQSVKASFTNGLLKITWQPATDNITAQQALRYNIYVKNNTTGKTWMAIPADINTGRIKVGTDLQTALSSHVKEYVMSLPDGDYTIGVQALDQSYAGSPFATASPTGINSNKTDISFNVEIVKGGLIVKSPMASVVSIFNTTGTMVAQGSTNELIPITNQGLYVLSVDGKSSKIIL
ncbi:family 43 glycosylhydrolase [Dysgonomonas sp. 216]|uniref:family 43 glycosylhydrolase n=1 Tax=Dysgonomonas sp. 216 TaxID=2302934 RepID=UPI00351A795F